MRALGLLVLVACGSPPPQQSTPNPTAPPPAARSTPCGASTCKATEICVPGGPSRNGIGATVNLPPTHCAPIPAACNGVATCACADLCQVGGCVSIEAGRLLCVAG